MQHAGKTAVRMPRRSSPRPRRQWARTPTAARLSVRGMTAGAATIPGDSTLAFRAEGYRFGHERFERYGTDAFRTRLVGRRVSFLRGADAARFYYESDRFTRTGA